MLSLKMKRLKSCIWKCFYPLSSILQQSACQKYLTAACLAKLTLQFFPILHITNMQIEVQCENYHCRLNYSSEANWGTFHKVKFFVGHLVFFGQILLWDCNAFLPLWSANLLVCCAPFFPAERKSITKDSVMQISNVENGEAVMILRDEITR